MRDARRELTGEKEWGSPVPFNDALVESSITLLLCREENLFLDMRSEEAERIFERKAYFEGHLALSTRRCMFRLRF